MTHAVPTPSITVSRQDPTVFNLNGVRIAYAQNLNAPQAAKSDDGKGSSGAPRYNCCLLIPSSAAAVLETLKKIQEQVLLNKMSADKAVALWRELSAGSRLGVKSGDLKATKEGFVGHEFLSPSARAEKPPLLLNRYFKPGTNKIEELTRPQNVIYSGCYVNAQCSFWFQDNQFGRRINSELLVVQFHSDGPSFAAGATADLDAFGGEAAAEASMGFGGFGGAAPAAAPAAPVTTGSGFGFGGAAPF